MAYKLKIGPSQSLRLKGQAGFALPMIGGAGVAAAKSGGVWTVNLDYEKMPSVSTVNDDTAYVLSWDSATGLFTRLNVTDLKAEIESTFDDIYQPLDATLTALAALDSTAGLLAQTGADTFERRTLTGTANEITVTNGAGTAGNPTVSLPAALTFTGKTVTGGAFQSPTITTPTGIVKGDVGLGNVDNTSDANKPVSTATQTALDGKQPLDADLTAIAALSSTGIARRTGTNTWSAGTAVANSELATAADGTIKSNISGSSAAPSDNTISAVLDKLFGTTQGSVIYRGASAWAALTPGTSGQFLKTLGAAANPAWDTIPGGGDLLSTNNLSDVASAATSRANLGVSDTLPTTQRFTSGSGTYTTPAGVRWIRVKLIGGGGGGQGSGTSAGNGGTGGTTSFGSTIAVGNGGTGGSFASTVAGVGGTATSSSGQVVHLVTGGYGGAFASVNAGGGTGGNGVLGGSGTGGRPGAADPGVAGVTNTGGGGGGASTATSGSCGGGSGGYAEVIIGSPSATYAYAVGAAGTAGTAGSGGAAGGAGGSGVIIVEEFYR